MPSPAPPLPPLPSSLPLRLGPDESATKPERRSGRAVAAPEFSLFVCGLSSTIAALSSFQWEAGPVPHPWLNQARAGSAEGPLTLFRYAPNHLLLRPREYSFLALSRAKC